MAKYKLNALKPVFYIAIFILSINVIAASPIIDHEKLESLSAVFSRRSQRSVTPECHCINYNCGCCSHLTIERIGLNDTVCVNITYLPEEIGISFTVSIGNHTVYNETISARNPPPICFGVPYLKEFAEFCIKFYDLDITLHKFHGCIKLEARLGHIRLGDYDLGCFNIGNSSHPLFNLDQESNAIQIILT